MEEIINYIKLNYEILINTIDIYGIILFLVLTFFLLFFNKESKIKNTLLMVVIMMISFQLTFNILENGNKEEKNVIYIKEEIEKFFGKKIFEETNNKEKNEQQFPSVINSFN